MSYALQIKTTDLATPVLNRLVRAITPQKINPIVGRSANNTVREHLFQLNRERPNQLGGKRTQFYAQAARGTQFQAVADGVVVSINQVGIAQRYYGGTIKPKRSKYLTIPVASQAYGKRASEFPDLELVFGKEGQPVALATKASSGPKGHNFGVILFRLVKSVTQAPDPTVLPEEKKIVDGIVEDVTSFVQRTIDRASGGAS